MRRLLNAYRRAFAGLPRTVWALAAAGLVNRSGSMVLPFLSLYLTTQLGFSPSTTGWVVGLYGTGSVGGSLLGGWLVDRLGAVRVQQMSLLGNALGFFLLPLARQRWSLAIVVLATSVVGEMLRPAMMSGAAQAAAPPVRARAMALIRLAHNLGFAVGPAVGGVLATINYHWLFIADGGTCAAAAMLLGAVFGWRTRPAAVDHHGGPPGPASWRRPAFAAFLAAVFALGMVFFQIFATLPLYWRHAWGLAESRIGLLLGINGVLIVSVEMLLVHRLERHPPLRVAAVGSLLVCLGFALMAVGRGALWAAVTVLVWTIGEMLAMPQINAVAASQGGPGESGRTMGAFTLAFSLAFVVAPLTGMAVYQHWGGTALWLGIGALGPLLATTLWLLAPHLGGHDHAAAPGLSG
ncbi:MAG TPA: MFS transporter [Thermoanaerobaculaceae bacterium]|nr:MFS transporter [Thermoanaerobaculaceae bacterium]HPS76663.1 MFS transporter [Thermoanaerobaculaceae bacterium]